MHEHQKNVQMTSSRKPLVYSHDYKARSFDLMLCYLQKMQEGLVQFGLNNVLFIKIYIF